jgi:hypothetical protein
MVPVVTLPLAGRVHVHRTDLPSQLPALFVSCRPFVAPWLVSLMVAAKSTMLIPLRQLLFVGNDVGAAWVVKPHWVQ